MLLENDNIHPVIHTIVSSCSWVYSSSSSQQQFPGGWAELYQLFEMCRIFLRFVNFLKCAGFFVIYQLLEMCRIFLRFIEAAPRGVLRAVLVGFGLVGAVL